MRGTRWRLEWEKFASFQGVAFSPALSLSLSLCLFLLSCPLSPSLSLWYYHEQRWTFHNSNSAASIYRTNNTLTAGKWHWCSTYSILPVSVHVMYGCMDHTISNAVHYILNFNIYFFVCAAILGRLINTMNQIYMCLCAHCKIWLSWG